MVGAIDNKSSTRCGNSPTSPSKNGVVKASNRHSNDTQSLINSFLSLGSMIVAVKGMICLASQRPATNLHDTQTPAEPKSRRAQTGSPDFSPIASYTSSYAPSRAEPADKAPEAVTDSTCQLLEQVSDKLSHTTGFTQEPKANTSSESQPLEKEDVASWPIQNLSDHQADVRMDASENASPCVTSVNSRTETPTQSLTRSASFASDHSKTEETEEKSVSDPKFSDGVALQIEVNEDQTSVKVQVATHTSAAKPEINSNAGADTSPASKTEQSTSENRQHVGQRISTQLKGYFNHLQSALGVLRNAIEQAQLNASPKPQPSVTSTTPDNVARSNICRGSDVDHDAIIQRAANGHIEALKDAIKNNRDSIFQFVSRQAHKAGIATETRRINGSAVTLEEVPLLTFLKDAVKSKADTNPLGFTSIGSDISVKINTTEADKQQQGAVGYKKSIIEVYYLDCLYTIQVMEVAPSFRNSVLNPDDLQTVRQLYRELENQTAKTQTNARPSNGSAPARGAQSPLIYSYAGVGRNATLLTFDLIASEIDDGLITDEAKIEERVREAIDSGRKSEEARLGHKASSKAKPLFVHSDAQIEKIIEAAKGHLKNHLKNVPANTVATVEDLQLPKPPAAIFTSQPSSPSARSSDHQHA